LATYRSRRYLNRPTLTLAGVAVLTFVVGTSVEALRAYLNPSFMLMFPRPRLLMSAAVIVNVAFHIWNPPETEGKVIASAFLTQVGLPMVLVIAVKFAESMVESVIDALRALTSI